MDYSRFGRQIALSDLGLSGQEAIAHARVYFDGPASAVDFAALCWKNCGGTTVQNSHDASVVVQVAALNGPSAEHELSPNLARRMDAIDALALGAAAACEAAQRVLTSDPSRVADFSASVATALMDRVGRV